MRYSAFSIVRNALSGHRNWQPAWRNKDLKSSYDVVIVGGGGHGLATAYYLAKNHGITNVAVLEKSWIGGGNTGRNTTVVRSNYFYPESVELYGLAHRLYEGLASELNYNVMLSQRGMVNLLHSQAELEIGQVRRVARVADQRLGLTQRVVHLEDVALQVRQRLVMRAGLGDHRVHVLAQRVEERIHRRGGEHQQKEPAHRASSSTQRLLRLTR